MQLRLPDKAKLTKNVYRRFVLLERHWNEPLFDPNCIAVLHFVHLLTRPIPATLSRFVLLPAVPSRGINSIY
jgi:hypothetical protein